MDFREEAFLNGFSEGLDKVAGPRMEALRGKLKGAGGAISGAAKKGVAAVKGAPGWIKRQWQGTQKSETPFQKGVAGKRERRAWGEQAGMEEMHRRQAPKASFKDIYEGIRHGKGDVRKGALSLLGKRALIAGVPATGVAAGGLGLRAALKKKKEPESQ